MNSSDFNNRLIETKREVDEALAELDKQARAYPEAERNYRRAKAIAYLATHGTVAEREAHAEDAVNELRYKRDLADSLRSSALEAVRTKRGYMSALQTYANLAREESALDRTGTTEQPQWGASG